MERVSMDILEEGTEELFTDPDPDKAREYFRGKSRNKTNKQMSLKDAVKRFIHNGEYLAIGGFGSNRTPLAACNEIVRQGLKNMGFAGNASTHDFQVLAAGEVFDRVDMACAAGMEARGISLCARRYLESGRVRICEWSNFGMAARLKAAAMGMPFITARNMMATDTFKYSAAKIIKCPFTGKQLVMQPALYPDVAVIHVHEADIYGNCRIRGSLFSDDDLARAAKKLIITAERIIPNDEIRRNPMDTVIPYYLADAVCEVPYGAYPGSMPYEYFSDEEHLKEWLSLQHDDAQFRAFLRRNIYECQDHAAYIQINGGTGRLKELRARELMLHKEESHHAGL
jgi:glutaconate CoA-transferase subunit A